MTWISNGTVDVTNGNVNVTGTGTTFATAGAQPGDIFDVGTGSLEIASVVSDTALTLVEPYAGPTASGQAYKIIPTQSRNLEAINAFTAFINAGAGRFADGTLGLPGIAFSDETGTGIRRPGANQIALTADGADLLSVSSTGASGSAVFDTGPLVTFGEGTFSPELADAQTGGNVSVTPGAGFYQKYGEMVFCQIRFINIDTTGMSAGGQIWIRGLPFAADNAKNFSGMAKFKAAFVTIQGDVSAAFLDDKLRLQETQSGLNNQFMTISDIQSGTGDIFLSIIYMVA